MSDLAYFFITFEGDAWNFIHDEFRPMKITELVSEVGLTQSLLTYQNRDLYRGTIVSVERSYRRNDGV